MISQERKYLNESDIRAAPLPGGWISVNLLLLRLKRNRDLASADMLAGSRIR